MTKPIRIQRKRIRGWKMPQNTVYVGRPTKWGNRHNADKIGQEAAVRYFKNDFEIGFSRVTKDEIRRELRGKNLACWCPIGSPCHVDVLLEIANSEADAENALTKFADRLHLLLEK